LDWIQTTLLACLVVGFVIGLWNHVRIIGALRNRHGERWKELGSPTLIHNNSIANSRRLRAFLKNREYEQLDDAALSRLARLQRVVERGYMVVILLFAIHFFVDLIVSG